MFSELSLLSAQVLPLAAVAGIIVHVPLFFPSALLGSFCSSVTLSAMAFPLLAFFLSLISEHEPSSEICFTSLDDAFSCTCVQLFSLFRPISPRSILPSIQVRFCLD